MEAVPFNQYSAWITPLWPHHRDQPANTECRRFHVCSELNIELDYQHTEYWHLYDPLCKGYRVLPE